MNIIDVGLNFNSNMQYGNIPNKIVLHHAEASKCTVEDINSWHKANGWAGIGYHYFIRKDGSVYRGRADNAIGSHCKGSNTGSLGICFEGDYTKETMPKVQYNAGVELIKYLFNKYGTMKIYGHRELFSTECPGYNFPLENFKNLKTLKTTSYVVTNYLPNGYKGDGSFDGVDADYVLQYFNGIRCYFKGNEKGVWIETQELPLNKCEELKNILGTWFYEIK
jgi:hypothetical protein